MLNNKPIKHKGIKRCPRKGEFDNPGARAEKPGWTDEHQKLMAKILSFIHTRQKAGGMDALIAENQWAKEFGITTNDTWKQVCHILPDLEEECLKEGTKTHPKKLLHNRVYYMYHTPSDKKANKLSDKRVSAEHPYNSKMARPFLDLAETLYIRNKPVSKEKLYRLMADCQGANDVDE